MKRGFAILCPTRASIPSSVEAIRRGLADYGWSSRISNDSVTIFTSDDVPIAPLSGNGFLIGNAFHRHIAGNILKSQGDGIAKASEALKQRALHEFAWGSFLAGEKRAGGSISLYRSPFGGLQAFYAELDCGWLVISHIPAWLRKRNSHFSVDLPALAAQLARPSLMPHQSCIRGIKPLVPGVYYEIDRGLLSISVGWQPVDFLHSEGAVEDMVSAQELVRREVLRCVGEWGSAGTKAQLDLSGGLDSSLIASALPSGLDCVNFWYPESDSDERSYAELVARARGHKLSVYPVDPRSVDPTRSAAELLPWPAARSFVQAPERQAEIALATSGGDAYLSGHGGDQVFCSVNSTAPIVEAIPRLGLIKALFLIGTEVASAADSNLWHVSRKLIGRTLRFRRLPPLDYSLLSRRAVRAVRRFEWHPWLQSARRVPRARAERVAALVRADCDAAGFERGFEHSVYFPLLSQPLVEACLRVPMWLWFAGGIDRAVVRRAMADRLPSEIASRGSKGGFNRFNRDVFEHHRGTIMTLVMDGRLRSAGLLDEKALALITRPGRPRTAIDHLRLMRIADIEAWAAAWA